MSETPNTNEQNNPNNQQDGTGQNPMPPMPTGKPQMPERPERHNQADGAPKRPGDDDRKSERPTWLSEFSDKEEDFASRLNTRPPQRASIITIIIIFLVAFFIGSQMMNMVHGEETDDLTTSEFVQAVEQGRVENVVYNAGEYTVTGKYYPAATAGSTIAESYNSAIESVDVKLGTILEPSNPSSVGIETTSLEEKTLGTERNYTATYVGQDSLMELLSAHPEVEYQVTLPSNVTEILISVLPMLLFAGLLIYFFSQMSKANNSQMSFGKAKAKKTTEERPDVRFSDVAGEDEAVEELQEIKDFLVNPGKYQKLGAKIPRGCLLVGPPGTGKTLLARAVAGEANVPFFSISGSEFVEMFVGVGASRVRNLFEQAKEAAPSIIFIDEIDAVGRQRGTGLGGGHDEREQTLNQLLVEMDGFEKNDAVVLIAATNRVDVLDPALLRPGRFDRQIVVDGPDVKGRVKILEVHAKNKPIGEDVDLERIAKLTSGMTGADLMNLMNEAALLTARRNKDKIGMDEVNESMERLMAGPERKTRVLNEKTRRTIAYHESGHALVGHMLENADPVHKITIVPRGMALGYTMSIPDEDKFLVSRSAMLDELAVFMGGRVAEEIFCGDITTGASNDLERATKTARKMVVSYGMSEALGQQTFGQPNHEVFLGRDYGNTQDYSPETAQRIDEEVARLMKEAHDTAYEILSARQEQMHTMAKVLLERETVDGEECQALLNNTWDEFLAKKQAEAAAKAADQAEQPQVEAEPVAQVATPAAPVAPAVPEAPQPPAAPQQ
ncbi:ATP-dependent zinc metalloprotease FtsH [Slackia heliotrinireducens]|uniref:ATP-dependent zinc metalloprotease FtsH n=1 Tax=Slackia heliotrinireducens (strain ATCC 29202 / DSM 20476 / NCTC 11029 / RHS 1) TaxID=471855 RepID=FTSH_SLAHD|nr:ATP-dependent zinc metalloprotease FtsH [Slackia heliotrinireducens]C7N1I1.1 RecName: Full=ATP-dependent zinc metalloprotease FtsH [Slackia heliotrinireducens DSM 20476]ACV21273.1 membrane protease FtsH catalytic subunit [Slackia heliotrinireducens DSM 20476]VEG98708.1 ATP-dependent zinc metalloprotease FtsH [Slackia heliotrinireducens]